MSTARRIQIAAVVILTVLLLTVTAMASGPYELTWYFIGGGGVQCQGGPYTLAASIGHTGESASGGAYSLTGGFWAGVPPAYLRYLPIILR
ncbi:MAG: hypothetical protein H5T65_08950 [Chloroflexi bacterium]|nr:hypothetical protein [Chloroflexota bacterium]